MTTTTNYKVLIPTSGIGTPLGDVTKYTNKSLIKVGKKPVISYIMDSYPEDTEFVVTVGYFADQVRDFLKLVFPRKKITLVEVDKYHGSGSSLGYSMLKASDKLQTPFIYHASDTIVDGIIPPPDHNWAAGFKGQGSSQYASFDALDGKVRRFYEKGMMDPDYLHIGVVGIKNYKDFWEMMEKLYNINPEDSALGDVPALTRMAEEGIDFKVNEVKKWYDTGNVESLQKARREIKDSFHILDKLEEAIFLFDKFVVKFFHDKNMVRDRVERGKILKGLVPKIENSTDNFYRYKFVKGDLYSDVANPYNFPNFLTWAKDNLWKKTKGVSSKKFKEVCYNFYCTKTMERIDKFLTTRGVKDEKTVINGEEIPSLKYLLSKINFDWLARAQQSNFHGDFILDNIIKTRNGYSLLDWRQNFGGLLEAGDMYYDLAKLNHNLTVNHGIVNDNLFTIEINQNKINCDILRKENLVQCQRVLFDFLRQNKYNEKKVKLLTAIIWLNMSPLHHHPFDLFLFYFGKLNLWREVNNTD